MAYIRQLALVLLTPAVQPVALQLLVLLLILELGHPPDRLVEWVAFLVSILLASLVAFALRFCVNLTAFWLLDNRGVDQLVTLVLTFFGGLLIPVVLFPPWLEAVARALPFAAMVQLPAEVFLGRHDQPGELLAVLATQVAWFAALWFGGRLMLSAATRKVVVQGG